MEQQQHQGVPSAPASAATNPDAGVGGAPSTAVPKNDQQDVQLSDEQILTQMQAIKDEQANVHPLVADSEDLEDLQKEYENGSDVFKTKILVMHPTVSL